MLLGEQIDEFSLGLVSPLQPDNASTRQVKNLKKSGPNNVVLNTRMYVRSKAVVKGGLKAAMS